MKQGGEAIILTPMSYDAKQFIFEFQSLLVTLCFLYIILLILSLSPSLQSENWIILRCRRRLISLVGKVKHAHPDEDVEGR